MVRWRIREAEYTVGLLNQEMGNEVESQSSKSPVSFWKRLQDDLVTVTKARLSILVVLTAVFGYLVATKSDGSFSWPTFLHMIFGTTLAAFGSAVFNQLMEVDADAKMRRTSDRPLPANRMPKPFAFVLGWLLCAFGLIHLGVKVNIVAAAMAAATLLTYLFIYTPLKRVSTSNTIVGAVSGALPPLIGWTAGAQSWYGLGAIFLFALLFLWQMPHFAAINWMYREEYKRGGFVMWSNEDESGRHTAKIATFFAVLTFLFGVGFPLATSLLAPWGAVPCGLLGLILLLFSLKFLKSGERADARKLFFYTLLYLPLMMVASYLAWT
ncbi:MAG: heme o synthase [Verrucomicrobiales bacterium]|nr:heme o synthase [Verrucomicrobiales bacterium]